MSALEWKTIIFCLSTASKAALPEDLRKTAFALDADFAASDQSSNPSEQRFLQLLAGRLKLGPLVVAALARSAAARHRGVWIICDEA